MKLKCPHCNIIFNIDNEDNLKRLRAGVTIPCPSCGRKVGKRSEVRDWNNMSAQSRTSINENLTYGEFKKMLEKTGVTDNTIIRRIKITPKWGIRIIIDVNHESVNRPSEVCVGQEKYSTLGSSHIG